MIEKDKCDVEISQLISPSRETEQDEQPPDMWQTKRQVNRGPLKVSRWTI